MPSEERLKRQLLEFAIFTLITVFVWIGYSVYTALSQPAETNVSKEELLPLPPPLDSKRFAQLHERLIIDEEELIRFPIQGELALPTPIPLPELGSPAAESSPAAITP